jgi:hypothetical protein
VIEKRVAAFLLAACLWGCQGSPISGTEIPNELVGREVVAGKGPAADADIRLVPVAYVPGGTNDENMRLTLYKAKTDSAGRFSLAGVQPGQYNILAVKDGLKSLRDSVPVTETGLDLGNDTLKLPGTLFGQVALQPNHDARSVTVQVLGTNLFVNVDRDGRFLLKDLAPGQYRLRVETTLDGYTPLFSPVEVRSGRLDTLPPLEPFYVLIPVVTGLHAESSRDGCIRLAWDRTAYPNSDGYLIYRDSAQAILPSINPIARVQKTSFIDTLYSASPKAGQFSFEDSSIREFTYRVRLLDAGGQIGPAYAKAAAFAYSPEKATVSGKWRLATDSAAFGARGNPAVAEFGGRLWIIGGIRSDGRYYHDIWSSADGIAWRLELDSLPIDFDGVYRAAVLDSTLWILAMENGPAGPVPVCYASLDGRHWARAGGPVNPAPQSGMDFMSFEGKLWIIGGSPDGEVFSSLDGKYWARLAMPEPFKVGVDPGTVINSYGMWIIGGGEPTDSLFSRQIWLTVDGHNWIYNTDTTDLMPRSGQRLIAAGNDFYSIGGTWVHSLAEGGVEVHDLTDQVWTSPNGVNWQLFDSHAPFGKRYYPAVVWFQGKVWCIGGLSSPTGSALADIWMMTP